MPNEEEREGNQLPKLPQEAERIIHHLFRSQCYPQLAEAVALPCILVQILLLPCAKSCCTNSKYSSPVKPENFFGDGSEETASTFLGEVICPEGESFAWTVAFFFGVLTALEVSSAKRQKARH